MARLQWLTKLTFWACRATKTVGVSGERVIRGGGPLAGSGRKKWRIVD